MKLLLTLLEPTHNRPNPILSALIFISDPMQWSIDNLKLPESSMRDNPEFQEILNQLKMAESQNWQIDEESKTNLAISLSQFMFKNQFNENPVKPRYPFDPSIWE